ncbi:MAG: M1 family metallopeptidase [Clostridia bacterium]|nr:M1 family metallopeptidase [Clostridia bacterium]
MRKKWFSFLAAVLLIGALIPVYGCGTSHNITAYEIDCEYADGVICGTEKVSFYNSTDNAFKELKFNLFANAFREGAKYSPVSAQYHYQAYKWGESYGETEIKAVRIDGEDVEFTVGGEDKNILYVPLKTEVFPNERATVEIEFKTILAKVIARTGVNADTVNLANFYPILCGIENGGFYECVYYANGDPFFSEPADYTVTLTRDKKYVAAASGALTSETEADEKITSRYAVNNARSFAFVLSDKFEVITDKVGDTEILYYGYGDENPEEILLTARQALTFFADKWGEYPYKTYSVVKTPFIQGGMEFTALSYVSDNLESAAFKEVTVHEAAHEWWQTVVGNNEIEHPFIDEGLAEYSVVLFYEAHPEYGYTRENLIKSAEQTYKVYCSVYNKIVGKVDTTMTRAVPEYTSEYEYVNISYVKACIMYDYLRQTVGDTKFFAGLKRFYDENAFKTATPESLVGAFERAGANSNGFFESFFDGTVII